jgi:hypothetical protein
MPGICWIASRSLFKTIHRIVLPPAADTPHFAMTGRLPVAADDVLQNRHDGEEEEEGR